MLAGAEVDAGFRERLERWKIRSPVVKFNAALDRLPNWTAAPGRGLAGAGDDRRDRHDGRGPAARSRRCEAGEPAVGFGEIYIQTGYDPSPRRRESTC